MTKKLVVTRHPGLVEYLLDIGIIVDGEYEVLSHASPEAVEGKDVIGVLPHSLSCLTTSFTEVPMHIPAELRGQELTLEHMHMYAKAPVTYTVKKV